MAAEASQEGKQGIVQCGSSTIRYPSYLLLLLASRPSSSCSPSCQKPDHVFASKAASAIPSFLSSTISILSKYKKAMARIQSEDNAQAAREDSAGPSSSNKPFPQRYTVVEHLPSGSSTVSQSNTTAGLGAVNERETSDSDRFLKNSQQMEQRATNDFRNTLRWVSTMSGGPVDRRLLREAVGVIYLTVSIYVTIADKLYAI